MRQTAIFRAGEEGYHTCRIPALLVSRKGTLLAFCEGRKKSSSDSGDIDLLLKRSFDGGKTWSQLQVVADHDVDTIGNPCPVVDRRDGTIWLPLTGNPGHITQKQILDGKGARKIWITRSSDDGATWAPDREITNSVKDPGWTWCATGPGNAIQLGFGRLLIPCDYSRQGTATEHSYVIYSDDHGETWKIGGTLREGTGESQVVELADGSLMVNARNLTGANRRWVAQSRDGGLTWSEARTDQNLIEPGCQGSIIRFTLHGHKSKNRLLFSNPGAEKRIRMTVRLSYDEGETWPVARQLWEGPSGYSSLAVLSDRTIGCLYENGEKRTTEQLSFARFNLEWLTGGLDRLD